MKLQGQRSIAGAESISHNRELFIVMEWHAFVPFSRTSLGLYFHFYLLKRSSNVYVYRKILRLDVVADDSRERKRIETNWSRILLRKIGCVAMLRAKHEFDFSMFALELKTMCVNTIPGLTSIMLIFFDIFVDVTMESTSATGSILYARMCVYAGYWTQIGTAKLM